MKKVFETMSFAFDTLKFSRALEKEGIYDHEKADAFVAVFSEFFSQAFTQSLTNTLATKEDLHLAKGDLKEEAHGIKEDLRALELKLTAEISKNNLKIEQLRSELVEKIEHSKTETMKWFVGLLLGQAALIATLVKLL